MDGSLQACMPCSSAAPLQRSSAASAFSAPPRLTRRACPLPGPHPSPHRRTSLRILGTVGEPINPEAWRWYYEVVGNGNVSVVDTWWQTETGAHMITPLPGATPMKPGSGEQQQDVGAVHFLAALSSTGLHKPVPGCGCALLVKAVLPACSLGSPSSPTLHCPLQLRCPSLAWSLPSWTTRATRWRGLARGECLAAAQLLAGVCCGMGGMLQAEGSQGAAPQQVHGPSPVPP